jgi:hypothetical protein
MAGFELQEVLSLTRQKKKSIRDTAYQEGKLFHVRLWNTNIATINPQHRKMTLRTGGWRTPTTKERLNKLIYPRGYTIFQKRGSWFIKHPQGKIMPFEEETKIEY